MQQASFSTVAAVTAACEMCATHIWIRTITTRTKPVVHHTQHYTLHCTRCRKHACDSVYVYIVHTQTYKAGVELQSVAWRSGSEVERFASEALVDNIEQMIVLQCCRHSLLVVQLLIDGILCRMSALSDTDVHLEASGQ